ncbi:unnamed protein product [Lathyrus sativus]|nr:unnamed protein product [Lathyrus sativus]
MMSSGFYKILSRRKWAVVVRNHVPTSLRDGARNIIEVTLWDDYGKQFMSYNSSNKFPGPTLIVLTHPWCQQNQASGLPSLSNAWNESRLHINLEHPQVLDFKTKLGSTHSAAASTHSITQTSESFVQSGKKSWTNSNEVKSICHICEIGKDCFSTTIGTTKRFKALKHGWYFEACPSCKTSNMSTGPKFTCVCGVKDVEPVTK